MSCPCRCHFYGAGAMVSCDAGPVQPGGARSCQADAQLHAVPVAGAGPAGPVAAGAAEPAADGPQPAPVPPEEACVLPHGDEPRRRHVGLLCGRHYGELDGRLREIETLFALRDELLLPGPGGERVSGGGFGSPAPGRLSLMQVTDSRAGIEGDHPDVARVLAFWAWEVASRRRIAETVTGDVSQSVRLLRRERKWIAAQLWVPRYAEALRTAHRALATASGASMWPEPVGKCSNCQSNLYNPMNGADEIVCRKCKSSWSGVHYLRLRLIFEQEKEQR